MWAALLKSKPFETWFWLLPFGSRLGQLCVRWFNSKIAFLSVNKNYWLVTIRKRGEWNRWDDKRRSRGSGQQENPNWEGGQRKTLEGQRGRGGWTTKPTGIYPENTVVRSCRWPVLKWIWNVGVEKTIANPSPRDLLYSIGIFQATLTINKASSANCIPKQQ